MRDFYFICFNQLMQVNMKWVNAKVLIETRKGRWDPTTQKMNPLNESQIKGKIKMGAK